MADPVVILARQLPAMVDLSQVDEVVAVNELAKHAGWSAVRLREAVLEPQRDPDVTPRTLALLSAAAERAQHHAGRSDGRPASSTG